MRDIMLNRHDPDPRPSPTWFRGRRRVWLLAVSVLVAATGAVIHVPEHAFEQDVLDPGAMPAPDGAEPAWYQQQQQQPGHAFAQTASPEEIGVPEKFEGQFYEQILALAGAGAQQQRPGTDAGTKTPPAGGDGDAGRDFGIPPYNFDGDDVFITPDDDVLYHTVVIIVAKYGPDGADISGQQKAGVVGELELAGARDISAAQTLPFVTASVPVDMIIGLSLLGEVRLIGDGQIQMHSDASDPIATINATAAALATARGTTANGTGITVAVIDSELVNHPMVRDKITGYVDCTSSPCSNVAAPTAPTHHSDLTHGGLVAHYIGTSGHLLYNGIAPGAEIISIAAGSHIAGTYRSFDWVATNDVDVVNLSLDSVSRCSALPGPSAYRTILDDTVLLGTVVSISAGNSGPGYGTLGLSCSYNTIHVGGIDDRDAAAITMYDSSSRGPYGNTEGPIRTYQLHPVMKPEIVAPAVQVPIAINATTYGRASGTSFSAPQVSAAAAVLIGENGDLGPEGVRAALFLGADWQGPNSCTSAQFEQDDPEDNCSHARQPFGDDAKSLEILNNAGFGILNVGRSLHYALQGDGGMGRHIVAGDLFGGDQLQYQFDVAAANATEPVKVILTWLNNPYDVIHYDRDTGAVVVEYASIYNLDFSVDCPGMDTVHANSVRQNNEFAVFVPVQAGTCTVQVERLDAGNDVKGFALASTVHLHRSPSMSIVSHTPTAIGIKADFGMAIKPDTFTASDIAASVGNVSEPVTGNNQTFTFGIAYRGDKDITVSIPAGAVEYADGRANFEASIVVRKSFTTGWTTTSANQTVGFTMHVSGTATIDWGDGSPDASVTGNGSQTHTYENAGNHAVTIRGDLKAFRFAGGTDTPALLKSVDRWGYAEWSTMNDMFHSATNVVHKATDAPNLSGVKSMRYMFYRAAYFDGNLSGWNTSSVTDMTGMFHGATRFNGDLSGWNTSQVTSMPSMFYKADNFDGNLSGWDVSDVRDMNKMFAQAIVFNGDLSGWNTSQVTYMSSMFQAAKRFNGDISGWNTSSVTDMHNMFDSATVFNGDISGWDVSSVTNMAQMFFLDDDFNGDISGWDTSSVGVMSGMFAGATNFNRDISGWDVSKVFVMKDMFKAATSFDQNLGPWYVVAGGTTVVLWPDVPLGPRDIGRITLTSSAPGTIHASWAAPAENPANYRISWAKVGDDFLTYIDHTGNAFPTEPRHTITGLEGGEEYKVMVRASNGDWSGEVTITVAEPPDSSQSVEDPPPSITVDRAALPGKVATLYAQNDVLTRHNPYYAIETGHDSAHFRIIDGNVLDMTTPNPACTVCAVNVTASGDAVFEDGNNWRIIRVMLVGEAPAFVTTWQATDTDRTITIPVGDSVASYDIDWGDGNTGDGLTGSQTHNYTDTGNYTVTITGGFERIRLNGGSSGTTAEQGNARQLLSIDRWGTISWTDMADAFAGASNMEYRAVDAPVLSRVTDMSHMFEGAASFDGDISGWDTSRVTTMSRMFEGARDFNGNISGWNVSKATGMTDMFSGATNFDQNLGLWYVVPDGATVIDRVGLPGNVATLSAQNGFLDGHDPYYAIGTGYDSAHFRIIDGNVLDMAEANPACTTCTVNVTATGPYVFEDGNNWRIIQVNVVSGTDFVTTWQATDTDRTITIPVGGSKASYDIDWGDGNTGTGLTGNQNHTYTDAGSYNVAISGDFERIRLNGGSSGTTAEQDNARQLLSIDQWGTISWTSMSGAFAGASKMEYRAVDAPVLSRVTDMFHMFEGAASFDGDISGWDTSSVTTMYRMFEGAASFDGDISGWDTSRVTDMRSMFENAASFDGYISGWNVSKATNMTDMFSGATNFDQNLGPWYVVPDGATVIDRVGLPGNVATLSAQNGFLDGHSPTYAIGTGYDSAHFRIIDGNVLDMAEANPACTTCTVNVTATGPYVFEDGNNWRIIQVRLVGDFVTTWQATDTDRTITIPVGDSVASYDIDWGDGKNQTGVTGNQNHGAVGNDIPGPQVLIKVGGAGEHVSHASRLRDVPAGDVTVEVSGAFEHS